MSLDVYITVDCCDKCGRGSEELNFNVTHNLGKMAREVGVYECLWNAEEHGIKRARELPYPIECALRLLYEYPESYKQYNPANGWGTYEGFVRFLEELSTAAMKHPDGVIRISK